MLTDVQALSPGQFWFWSVSLSLLTLVALYFTFRGLRRARIIEDTPTARIRSAPQGYVELSGEAAAMPGEPILSPLTMTPCCWYRFQVERRHEKGWRTIRSGMSDGLFLLRDETGECIIDPEGAEVSPRGKNVWYDNQDHPIAAAHYPAAGLNTDIPALDLAMKLGEGLVGRNYRYTEETIYPGDRLYAIGLFKTLGEADRLAMREELVKDRLSQWKADHAGLLARFDRDGDGRIDLTEWEVARRTAKREVTAEQLREQAPVLNTLSQTDQEHRPFLISAYSQYALVKRYRLMGVAALIGFFLCGGVAVWLFTLRFAG